MKEYPLGGLLNTEDNRDIALSTVASALGIDTATHPKKNITDISMLTVEDQKKNGSCVGQAEGKDAEFQNFIETGKVVRLSKRALYAMCKAEDGYPGEGTYPRIAAKIRVSTGIPTTDLVVDDNNLPHSEYIKVPVTDALKTSASEFRSKGYSFVNTLEELKTAIDLTKAFNATLFVGDWSTLPVKPIFANGSYRGTHRIWVFGYEDAKNGKTDDTKVYYLNSWGINWAKGKNTADKNLLKKGVGYFWWSEYQNYFRDGIVYLDMPNEIIDYAKAQQYIFPRQLDLGDSGTDVMELQKRLAKEIALDGQPCFQYPDGFTTYFGEWTQKAVQRYQAAQGIVSHGTPKTTGYGRVGNITLSYLNKAEPTKPSNLMDKWADAIQKHEGWYPGSRSYRNNNPGNIKYIGQKRAIGSDGTFCIFATYADGRQELMDLLTRAASGKSSYYRPEMTLRQFYAVYAPSSDNNNPDAYALAVAKSMGISVDTQIKNILDGTAPSGVTAIAMENFAFLKSVRFWNLVIVATVIVLKKEGVIVDDTLVSTISEIIALVLGGSTVVRTIDRASEKQVEAAKAVRG